MSERSPAQRPARASRHASAPPCGLCHRPVGLRQAARARLGWRSLVVCDRCLDAAEMADAGLSPAA